MSLSNFERMLQLAEDVFAVRDDPAQLDVDEQVLERLRALHPSSVCEEDDGNGPVAWVLLLPTTAALMNDFLAGTITERELYERTPLGAPYDAVYLCSAMVLQEHRRKGIAKRLTLHALQRMRADHAIRTLFCWPFTAEGEMAAKALAEEAGLPLRMRAE